MLEKHAPLKRLNKQELKFEQKPWITQGLPISIKKNTLFSIYIKCTESSHKKNLHLTYKSYQNLLSTLLKDSREGIKSITSAKNESNNDSLTSIIHEENFITDPLSIPNVFKNFFSTVAQKVQSKIKFSSKAFSDFLPPDIHIIFL